MKIVSDCCRMTCWLKLTWKLLAQSDYEPSRKSNVVQEPSRTMDCRPLGALSWSRCVFSNERDMFEVWGARPVCFLSASFIIWYRWKFSFAVCSPGMWQVFWRSHLSLVQFESYACQVVRMRFVRAVAFLCAVDAHQNLRASQCVPLLDRLICQGTVAKMMSSYNLPATWFFLCFMWEFMNLDAEFFDTWFYSNSFSNTEQTLHPTILWR